MDLHITAMLVAGFAVMLMAILPRVTPNYPLSTPMVLLAFGFVAFSLPLGLPTIDPIEQGAAAEYLTEFAVIVALTGAGIKIDRPVGWRSWRSTWILLGITMPITIALATLLGWWAVGLAPATALLFGAVLAPTDPVLAGEVQVGPPGEGSEKEGRVGFALTSEAGLNDALAFPFTNAAIAIVVSGGDGWGLDWIIVDVVWKLSAGLLGGIAVGVVMGRLLFGTLWLSRYTDGLVALASTLLAYGLVEAVEGYGFLSVFVAALMIRDAERDHDEHRALHRFIEQVEHLALAVILVLLAGAVSGGVLDALTPAAVVVALLVVLVVRPLAGLPVLASEIADRGQGLAVAFFGIRGIGSLYYLAYGLNHADFKDGELLWATVTLIILVSVVVHGTTSYAVMRRVEPQYTLSPLGHEDDRDRDRDRD